MLPRPADLDTIPDGTPLTEVAARYGVSLATARRWLTRHDRPRTTLRPRRCREPHPETERIVRLYTAGLTQRQVAEVVGCSVAIVARVVQDARVVRPRGLPPRLDAAEVGRRCVEGESLAEIAASFGTVKAVVSRALDRAGVPRRPWGSKPPRG